MTNSLYKDSSPYVCACARCEGEELKLTVIGAPDGAEISLGGAFARLFGDSGSIRTSKIPLGIHTLFLHLKGQTIALCRIEKSDDAIRRIYTDEDVIRVESACIKLNQRLTSLEGKVKTLESEAFESVLF